MNHKYLSESVAFIFITSCKPIVSRRIKQIISRQHSNSIIPVTDPTILLKELSFAFISWIGPTLDGQALVCNLQLESARPCVKARHLNASSSSCALVTFIFPWSCGPGKTTKVHITVLCCSHGTFASALPAVTQRHHALRADRARTSAAKLRRQRISSGSLGQTLVSSEEHSAELTDHWHKRT